MDLKLSVARSQLGAALSLFLRDKDSVAVHVLACGGAEVIEGLADASDIATLRTHVLETFPTFKATDFYSLRNRYWNAFKHFYDKDNRTARNDEELISKFSDEMNDHVLFGGWLDYQLLAKKLPIEVQVFQAWYFATNEEKLAPHVDLTPFRMIFPQIMETERSERKRRLCRAIEKYRRNTKIVNDALTERQTLIAKAIYQ